MVQSIDLIRQPIANEMEIFEKKFKESMQSKVPLLDKITQYIIKRKGKQVRPMFVFLSAHCISAITEKTYRGAALVELLHTATLVHDDVVDDAYERRGFFSINALWKNKIAVLVGDYLLSKGLLLSLNNNDFQELKIVSDAVRRMSEGELLQIEKARRLDITEEVYFEIISNKTASLIASCCAVGASSAGADEATVELMRKFGETVGLVFQIKDDLLDFGQSNTGKAKGVDIKEKKLTLPLIYALNNTSSSNRRHIINIVKNKSNQPEKVQEVIQFIIDNKGIDYANEIMLNLRQKAFEYLDQLPNNQYRESLRNLVIFTSERKK